MGRQRGRDDQHYDQQVQATDSLAYVTASGSAVDDPRDADREFVCTAAAEEAVIIIIKCVVDTCL